MCAPIAPQVKRPRHQPGQEDVEAVFVVSLGGENIPIILNLNRSSNCLEKIWLAQAPNPETALSVIPCLSAHLFNTPRAVTGLWGWT